MRQIVWMTWNGTGEAHAFVEQMVRLVGGGAGSARRRCDAKGYMIRTLMANPHAKRCSACEEAIAIEQLERSTQ